MQVDWQRYASWEWQETEGLPSCVCLICLPICVGLTITSFAEGSLDLLLYSGQYCLHIGSIIKQKLKSFHVEMCGCGSCYPYPGQHASFTCMFSQFINIAAYCIHQKPIVTFCFSFTLPICSGGNRTNHNTCSTTDVVIAFCKLSALISIACNIASDVHRKCADWTTVLFTPFIHAHLHHLLEKEKQNRSLFFQRGKQVVTHFFRGVAVLRDP